MIGYTCVGCQTELVCEENDVTLIHFTNNNREDGIDALRHGDVYRCPKCGNQVVLGLGSQILGIDLTDSWKEDILKRRFVEVKR